MTIPTPEETRQFIQGMNKRKIQRGMAKLSLVLGIALLLGGSGWIHHTHMDGFLLYSAKTEGEVVENTSEHVYIAPAQGHFAHSFTARRAVIRFRDQNGKEFVFRDGFGFRLASFTVGEKVPVFYDPADPQRAQVDRGAKNLIVPGILLMFVIPMLLGECKGLRVNGLRPNKQNHSVQFNERLFVA